MGIPGLTTFIYKNFYDWEHKELEGHLVIDGYSLCYYLYTFQWNHGGEYPQYRLKVLGMFKALLKAKIHPIVVFDGIDYKCEKVNTTLHRKRECIKLISEKITGSGPSRVVLPMLTKEVFLCSLQEIHIPVYVVDGEADKTIVEVANFYNCPVLSFDSDYFMFNVEGGYIPLEKLYFETRPVTCDVFFLSRFFKQFAFKCEDLRFAIPAIVGNDFLTSVFTEKLIQCIEVDSNRMPSARRVDVARIVRCLQQYPSVEALTQQVRLNHVPHVSKLETNYLKAQELYNCVKPTDPETLLTCSVLRTVGKNPIPDWIIHRFRRGNFSQGNMSALALGKSILRVCPDVPTKVSSLHASTAIRQKLYYMLHLSTVTEFFREGLGLSPKVVASSPVYTVSPQLLTPYPLEVLCQVLNFQLSLLKKVEDDWKLVVMVTKYWTEVARVPTHLVKALVCCNIVCFTYCSSDLNTLRRKCVLSSSFKYNHQWMIAFHAFAQWQCCFMDTLGINQLLSPSLKVVSPALLFDGTIAMYMAEDLPGVLSKFPVDLTLYNIICSLVLRDVGDTAPKKASVLKNVDKKGKVMPKTSSKFEHSNPFSLLQTSESDSD